MGNNTSHSIDRHRDEGLWNTGLRDGQHHGDRSGSPRYGIVKQRDHAIGQRIDNLVHSEIYSRALQDDSRMNQSESNESQAVFVSPCSTESFNQLDFGCNPVGLRIKDGAVHVPENGTRTQLGRRGSGHDSQVYALRCVALTLAYSDSTADVGLCLRVE